MDRARDLLSTSPMAADAPARIQVSLNDTTAVAATWGEPSTSHATTLMLPGLMTAADRVAPLAQRLAHDRWVIALDYPGVGGSPRPDEPLTLPELARHVAEVVERIAVGRVDVVANSFGCQIATELALQRPELTDRLVLTSPTQDPSARTWPRLLARWRREGRTQSRRYKALMVRDLIRSAPAQLLETVRISMRDRIEDRLPHIEAPTLVVYGTCDPIIGRRWAQTVADLLPRGRLAVLPGAPHAMVFDAPRQAARVIERFLGTPNLQSVDQRSHAS
jgi:2-hydroxy-6-oxonona-2,4-dienedioate hydrolase